MVIKEGRDGRREGKGKLGEKREEKRIFSPKYLIRYYLEIPKDKMYFYSLFLRISFSFLIMS